MNLTQVDKEFLLTSHSRRAKVDDKDFLTFSVNSKVEMGNQAQQVEPKIFHKRKSMGLHTFSTPSSTAAQSNIGGMVSSNL
jgi:hypothetical protein